MPTAAAAAAAAAVLVAAGVVGLAGQVRGGFPMVTPTVGEVWPRPQSLVSQDSYSIISPETFWFRLTGHTCLILDEALDRYLEIMFRSTSSRREKVQPWSRNTTFQGSLDSLSVYLTNSCETYPGPDMDEQYTLQVDSPDAPGEASLSSQSVWGILRGLETFSQLLLPDAAHFKIKSTQIIDFPRFSFRGLMLDTSRHFLPLSSIHETLDLMAMNKLNVFHWHIVDDQSFPYESTAFPALSEGGAYSPGHVYSLQDVASVIEYARLRGIRVLPEFDTPGHTRSWGPGQPGLLTPCYEDSAPDGTFGPIDPSKSANYDFLESFFKEVTSRFPDRYVHLGADEVFFDCWESNPDIWDFMEEQGITGDYAKLEEYYITKLLDIIKNLPTDNGYLVWQDVFDNGVALADDTVVQVWRADDPEDDYMEEMNKVTSAGLSAVLSACWYLNLDTFGSDWFEYYECDPHNFEGTEAQKQLVLGGTACVWTEYEDKTNLIPRTWPRGSLVAEKLWSSAADTATTEGVAARLDEHRCRLLGRGHSAEPLLPSFCAADLD